MAIGRPEGGIAPKIVTIYDTVTKKSYMLPLTPEKLSKKAEANFISYKIINVGEVDLPNGRRLAEFSWSGVLPRAGMFKGLSFTNKGGSRLGIWRALFEQWRTNGHRLKLTVTGTPGINNYVYLKDYSLEPEHIMFGIDYSVTFIEAPTLVVKTTKELKIKSSKSTKKNTTRAASKTTKKTRTYTMKKGDSLWSISKKFYGKGSLWKKIYNANKKKLKGKNLRKLKVGTKLVIPY